MKGILQFSSFFQVQCTTTSSIAQRFLSGTGDMPTLGLQCNGFRFGNCHIKYVYFRYKISKHSFDFVVIEQLVLENMETVTGISNFALLWPQMS